jgi:hypothetical protein
MVHYSRLGKIVVDVPDTDHDQELAFWQSALGRRLTRYEHAPEYHGTDLQSPDLRLLIQRLEDGSGRVHLDIHTDDLDAEVARLEALGAVRVQYVKRWWVMRDPAGLPFCVIPAAQGSLNETNAQRWE